MKALIPRMTLLPALVLVVGLVLTGCGQDQALAPEAPTAESTIQPRPYTPTVSPGGVVGIARPYPWNPQPDKVLLQAFQDLMSGNPQQATAGLAVILDVDPQLYVDLLEYFKQSAPPQAQAYLDQLITEWWQYNKIAPRKDGDITPSDTDGGEKYATFEINGTIEIKKGSSVTVVPVIGPDLEFDLPTDTIPINSGEIGDQGGSTVTTTTLNLNDANFSLSPSFPIPHPLSPVDELSVDIEVCVNLEIIIRRKCQER